MTRCIKILMNIIDISLYFFFSLLLNLIQSFHILLQLQKDKSNYLIIPNQGIQITPKTVHGLRYHKFIETEKIGDELLKESFRMCRIAEHLAFTMKDDEEKLLIVFEFLSPNRDVIAPIYRHLKSNMFKAR